MKSQRGASIAELLVASFILLAVVAGLSKLTSVVAKGVNTVKATRGTEILSNRIRDLLERPTLFAHTIMQNPDFSDCLNQGSACVRSFRPLRIFSQVRYDDLLAGTPTAPAFFTNDGIVCPIVAGAQPTAAQCPLHRYPLESIAGFDSSPAGIRIFYCLRHRAGANEKTLLAGLDESPSCAAMPGGLANLERAVRPTREQHDPDANRLDFSAIQPCPAGQFMTGVAPTGLPVCGNLSYSQTTGYAENINGGACVPGQVSAGINSYGQPACVDLVAHLGLVRVDSSAFGLNAFGVFSDADVYCPAGKRVLNCSCGCYSSTLHSCQKISDTICRARCSPTLAWKGVTGGGASAGAEATALCVW